MERTPNRAALVRQAERVVAQVEAQQHGVVALWQGVHETHSAFAARLHTTRRALPARQLLLAVLPHDNTLPLPAKVRKVELPAKCFKVLHPDRPARFKVLKGGRGAAKSHSIARVLIVIAATAPHRVLCCREIQKSIRDSVHRLLSDLIEALGLSRYFEIGAQTITSAAGAEFIFDGLYANTTKIRSMEAIDIAWVEEAAKVSASSWEILEPTVREQGSYFLVNYNPEDKTDPTHVMFGDSPRPDAVVEHVTYADNPYFPEVLERARVYLLSVDPDAHAHVYGGHCRTHSDAQILKGKVVVEHFEPQATWSGPYHGVDWGFSQDPTVLVKCWIHERALYVEYEAYQVGCDIDRTPALFDQVPRAHEYLIRADSARPETISYLTRNGYPNMVGVEKWAGSVEDGVAHLRSYERIVIHPRCEHTREEASLYSFKVDRLTGDVLPDIVDQHNHCMDAIRYALMPLIRLHGGAGLRAFYGAQLATQAATTATTSTAPTPPPPPTAWSKSPERVALVERAAREHGTVADLTPWHQQ